MSFRTPFSSTEIGPETSSNELAGSEGAFGGDELDLVSPFRSTLLVVLALDLLVLLLWRAWVQPGSGGSNRLALVLVATVPIGVFAATKSFARRLVVRSLNKRRNQSALLALCGLLATTALTASWQLDAGFSSSAKNAAAQTLGPVDELIISSTAQDRTQAQKLLTDTINSTEMTVSTSAPNGWVRHIDGQLGFVSSPVLLEQGALALRATAIEIDPIKAANFGGSPIDTGFTGVTQLDGKAMLLGADVAARFDIDRSQPVRLTVGGGSLDLQVTGTLPRRGLAALSLRGEARPLVVFVASGTLVATAIEPDTLSYAIAISNKGDVREGLGASAPVANGLLDLFARQTLSSRNQPDQPDPLDPTGNSTVIAGDTGVDTNPVNVSVVERKKELFDSANKVNLPLLRLVRLLTMFLSLAVGAVLVGSCLSFASARKSELSTLRTLGFARSDLIGFFALEAWLIAFSSALLGSLLGTLFAWLAFPSGSGPGATGFSDLAPKVSVFATVSGFAASFTVLLFVITAALAAASLGTVANGTRKRLASSKFQALGSRWAGSTLAMVALALPITLVGLWTLIHGIGARSPFPLLVGVGAFGLLSSLLLLRFAPQFPIRVVVGGVVAVVGGLGPFVWSKVFKRMDTGSVLMQIGLLGAAGAMLVSPWGTKRFRESSTASTDPTSNDFGTEESVAGSGTGSGATRAESRAPSPRDFNDLEHHEKVEIDPKMAERNLLGGMLKGFRSLVNANPDERARMVPLELLAAQAPTKILPGSESIEARHRGSILVRKTLSSAYLSRPISRTTGVRFIVCLLTASVVSIILLRSSVATSVRAGGSQVQGSWQGVVAPQNDLIREDNRRLTDQFGVSAPMVVVGVAGSIGSSPLVGAELSIIESSYVDATPASLSSRLDTLTDDRSVWDRVISGDGVVVTIDSVADGSAKSRSARVGETVSLVDQVTGRSVSVPVVGVADALPGFGSVVAGARVAESLFVTVPPVNRLLVRPELNRVFDVRRLSTELAAQGLRYEPLSARLDSSTASTRRTLGLLQWLAGLIALAALWSFLASRAQTNADRAPEFASLRAVGADAGLSQGIVRTELFKLMVPGVLLGLLCALVLTLRVVWSGGLGEGTRFGIDLMALGVPLLLVLVSVFAGVVLLSRQIGAVKPLNGMNTRRVS